MKKPRNAYHWPNPAVDFYDEPDLKPGYAGTLRDTDPSSGQWAATIYVPDPTERNGWRQFFVYRQEPPNNPKPMGFR